MAEETQYYVVYISGGSVDDGTEYDDFDEAVKAAFVRAAEIAKADGVDVDDLDLYEVDDDGCDCEGFHGVCPPEHEGCYYPVIVRL